MLIWNRPRLVMIELTNLCNLRCYMCGIWEESPKKIFDLGLYERLVSRPEEVSRHDSHTTPASSS